MTESEKAAAWDKLGKQIEACYVNEQGEELTEEELEGIDLCTIGELAASAFGYLC
jgi:hypothetical protein